MAMSIKYVLKKRLFLLSLGTSIFAILFLYYPIIFKYFEQDEWKDYGWHIYYSHLFSLPHYLLFIVRSSSIPVTSLYNALNYLVFGVNNWFSAIVVLLLIGITSIVWYILVVKITKNSLIASSSLLFGYCNYLSSQAVTWVMPAVASQLSLLFTLLSLLLLFFYLEKRKKVLLIAIFVTSILAIFSKLNSFFIVLLLPLTFVLFDTTYTLRRKLITTFMSGATLFVVCFGLFVLKFGFVSLGTTRYVKSTQDIVFNSIFLPFKSISQIIIFNPSVIYNAVSFIVNKRYHFTSNTLYEQTILTELLSLIFSLLIVCVLLVCFVAYKKIRKQLTFFAFFYLLSFAPFVLDTFSTGNGFMESRYYQIAVFPLSAIICICGAALLAYCKKHTHAIVFQGIQLAYISIILLYLTFNCILIRQSLFDSIEVTTKRKEILETLASLTESAHNNTIILYVQDSNYPANGENITGRLFQTGIFYPFLVTLNRYDTVPYQIFSRDDIWSLDYQGVLTEQGKTYGIFYSEDQLDSYLKEHPEQRERVYKIVFDYNDIKTNNRFTGGVHDLLYVHMQVDNYGSQIN